MMQNSYNQLHAENYSNMVYRKSVYSGALEFLEWEIEIDHFRFLPYGQHPNQAVVRYREATHYLYYDHTEMKPLTQWREVRAFDIDTMIADKLKDGYHLSENYTFQSDSIKRLGQYFPSKFLATLPRSEENQISIDILEEYDYDSKE